MQILITLLAALGGMAVTVSALYCLSWVVSGINNAHWLVKNPREEGADIAVRRERRLDVYKILHKEYYSGGGLNNNNFYLFMDKCL